MSKWKILYAVRKLSPCGLGFIPSVLWLLTLAEHLEKPLHKIQAFGLKKLNFILVSSCVQKSLYLHFNPCAVLFYKVERLRRVSSGEGRQPSPQPDCDLPPGIWLLPLPEHIHQVLFSNCPRDLKEVEVGRPAEWQEQGTRTSSSLSGLRDKAFYYVSDRVRGRKGRAV